SFTWTSQDTDVATIDPSGVATAQDPGETVIRAAAEGVTGEAVLTVLASPPTAPSDVTSFAHGPERVRVSWTDNSSTETGFEVQRSLQAGGGFETVASTPADTTEFVDETVQAETTYRYRVRAMGAGGTSSDFSEGAAVTTLPPPNPASPFECERQGYPCTWPAVDPTVFEASDSLGDEVLLMLEDGETVAAALAWLHSRPNVVHAVANAESLRFRLQGGRPTWVLGPDAIRSPDGEPPPPTTSLPRLQHPPSRVVVGDEPKSKRALVLSPFQYELVEWNSAPGAPVASLLNTAREYEGNVEYYANTATEAGVSFDHFRNWKDYDVIVLITHGSQICTSEECYSLLLVGAGGYISKE
ncbi:MAG: hypothetical protein R3324_19895, partial [Halobacteriales archaeon]|nr:hypothetical protein [Halobacteriales archaeon]